MATRITITDTNQFPLTITSNFDPTNQLASSPDATEYTVIEYNINYQGIDYNGDNIRNTTQFRLTNATTNIPGFINSIVDAVVTAYPRVNDDDHPAVLVSIRNPIKKG